MYHLKIRINVHIDTICFNDIKMDRILKKKNRKSIKNTTSLCDFFFIVNRITSGNCTVPRLLLFLFFFFSFALFKMNTLFMVSGHVFIHND